MLEEMIELTEDFLRALKELRVSGIDPQPPRSLFHLNISKRTYHAIWYSMPSSSDLPTLQEIMDNDKIGHLKHMGAKSFADLCQGLLGSGIEEDKILSSVMWLMAPSHFQVYARRQMSSGLFVTSAT
jgi:hypothetical protein